MLNLYYMMHKQKVNFTRVFTFFDEFSSFYVFFGGF